MIQKATHFDLAELVCEHVYNKYGVFAWNFFDVKLLITLDSIRDRINKAIHVNDWQVHGTFTQRGLRCPECSIVKSKTELYMSAHTIGKAADFTVEGLLAEETRAWLIQHENWWPYPFRLESGVNWVHCDLFNDSDKKVIQFNP
jgi:hypothetical protein